MKEDILQKELDNLKELHSDIISIASHELKTPLTSIIGFTKIIKEKPNINEETREKCLKTIIQQSERMHRLINNMITWHQIKMKIIKIYITQVNISLLIKDILKNFLNKINKDHIKLTIHIEDDITFSGDEERLREIIENLLENSIKHIDEGLKIEVRAEKINKNHFNLTISNTGFILDEMIKESILNKNYPLLSGIKIDKSTALSLAISRSLVELLGGKIHFEPINPKGSKFIIEFT
ncbi:MAG: Phosphate regulon sensor protein PhoR [bacterium ADurb.Bin363]|nr:MAG: Phosphate regulon sensor protein PhoR [bacterium ADurb.Bin363]